jgi:hypothetical protein
VNAVRSLTACPSSGCTIGGVRRFTSLESSY